jgi:predicted alpha/beta hydrolase family esterase
VLIVQSRYRPIIFVAHSLGGLVVKQALVIAKNNDKYREIREATRGLVFFAVPHQGGYGASLGAIAKNIVTSLTRESRNDLVEALKQNSLFQENQATLFKHQLEDYQVVSIVEDRPIKLVKIFGIGKSIVRS